ncbi:class I SAM-dependent methyltransferase [uncultured Jatrophihabitans sp.]|uniref:class I SAM-dependent methyltransferase n=1 Tax=uncultured Jatrophihabitans sp. TaxID=1610747 RepID=UPI0035CA2BA4
MTRATPAGDYDYERGGAGYAAHRQTDPRIAAYVHAALGDARTVVNVGAGAGSYEPDDREVTAVEPSAAMRAQRPADREPAVDAVAESLPFADDTFDAAMATITIHQWPDLDSGLRELRRVSRGPVVIMTFDGEVLAQFWLAEYAPGVIAKERVRYPSLTCVCDVLGGRARIQTVPIPIDCTDWFGEALYARPEQFLDADVRLAQSAWGLVDEAEAQRSVQRLRADLDSGEWDQRFGYLRERSEYAGSLRLVVAEPGR